MTDEIRAEKGRRVFGDLKMVSCKSIETRVEVHVETVEEEVSSKWPAGLD